MKQSAENPSVEEMEAIARRALLSLPETFREHLGDIVLQVEDFATTEQLSAVGLSDKWDLSGLYQGHPISLQSVWASGDLPPRIWLFRQPILAEHRSTGEDLVHLIRHIVVHEAGHHFGFSDEDMHRLEDEAR